MTSTTTEERIELSTLPAEGRSSLSIGGRRIDPHDDEVPEDAYSTTAIPDGGYGWTVVFCCSMITFWVNSILNCWGVLQAALLTSTLQHVSTSTLSFVGSLNLAGGTAFGLLAIRFMRWFGTRTTAVCGTLLMGMSLVVASFCTENLAGLFVTVGLVAGIGQSGVYTVCNALPVQYFSGRLGLANGLVKAGGGIGGCVMAIALEAMNQRVGIAWTFRIQGLMTIITGLVFIPAESTKVSLCVGWKLIEQTGCPRHGC
jgi:MCP family monocarboxylic acid transporter-like MFS transporter 3